MSSGPVRRVSPKDIQVVQNLIEGCLQLYMNRKEVVQTLLARAKIEPGFTELVWQKLEEENRDFFKAYYLRLMVKHQIMQFNKLLEQQVQLMQRMKLSVPPMPTNGSQIPPLQQNSDFYALEHFVSPMKPESRHHTLGPTSQNFFTNGGSSLNSNIHRAVDMSVHDNRIDVPGNMIPVKSSNIGLMHGINGGMIKSETGYSGTSPYLLDGSLLEPRPSVADASLASFSSVESTQALNVPLLDADTTTFGFLGYTPGNFGLLDLSNDFAQSSDILESYSARSPFIGTENENFLDSHEREHQGEGKGLDSVSEGMSYEDFGSQ